MAKVVVRLPEPKEEYDFSNQKQINRAIALVVEQLTHTFVSGKAFTLKGLISLPHLQQLRMRQIII